MLSLAERVDRTILRYSLLPPGARAIAALSGGADSTALACLLVELARRRGFLVVAAAHFNHGLRPEACEEDEAFCREVAQALGLAWLRGSGDVRSYAKRHGLSLEDVGRRLRYDFLRHAAAGCGATHVAVGHTRDDQAETVLLQMIRGAGPRGLRGMAASRPLEEDRADTAQPLHREQVRLVRPLLEVGHDDLVAWLGARGQAYREDESNRDLRFARNRVRHELIPLLRERLSPSISSVLAGNAEIAASDAEFLDAVSARTYESLARVQEGRVDFDVAGLASQPDAIRRRVVLLALRNLGAPRFVGREQARRIVALAESKLRGPLDLPGAKAWVAAGRLVLERCTGGREYSVGPGMNFSRSALSIPGEARVAGAMVSSFLCPWTGSVESARATRSGPATEAIVDASRFSALGVRTRQPGDSLRPLGMGGHRKKLQDYLVDRKVPRDMRDSVPLVVDQADRIVWVAGHGIDEEFRVREGTHDVVILRMRGDSF